MHLPVWVRERLLVMRWLHCVPSSNHTMVLKAIVFAHVVSRSHSLWCLSNGEWQSALLHLQIENILAVICFLYVFVSMMSKVFLIIIKAAGEVQGLHNDIIYLLKCKSVQSYHLQFGVPRLRNIRKTLNLKTVSCMSHIEIQFADNAAWFCVSCLPFYLQEASGQQQVAVETSSDHSPYTYQQNK